MDLGVTVHPRRGDYTQAAVRALKDALWHNSLGLAKAFCFPKDAMLIDVEIALQQSYQVDTGPFRAVLPRGQTKVTVKQGGLDIAETSQPQPAGVADKTIVAHTAVLVVWDMEPPGKHLMRYRL